MADDQTFDALSLDDQTELMVAAHGNLLPEDNVARNSDNWKRLRIPAMGVTDNHAHIEACFRDAMPDRAGEATIERHGAIHGVPRKGATPASAEDAGLIKGANGSTWSTSNTLIHKSGLTFRPSSSGTVVSGGQALVGIVAVDTGPQTRLTKGEVLRWSAAPTGLENEVELQVDLSDGGANVESIGDYRARILERTSQGSEGGTSSDWHQWALAASDAIATAYVYPNRNGLLSVDVAALKAGSGTSRLLDAGERAALLTYLNSVRPVGAAARVLEVVTETQDVEVIVLPESEAALSRDWDDNVPLEVDSWTAGTRTLVFTTTRPSSLAIGDRLVVAGTSGVVLVVESLSGTDGVVLVDAKGQTPGVGALVYAGGALTTPVRDAILEHFDGLGPRVGSYGVGGWIGDLRVSQLFEVIQTTDGVLDSTIVTPAANVSPSPESYPDDAQVRLIIPGNVLVRYTA